jgi:dipeptidyl aminopeptidase/acylaminoacyl peptidase
LQAQATEACWHVAFSPDGKTVAVGGDDHTIRLWETATGREIRRLTGHAGAVYAVAFSGDGQTLASGGEDGTIRLWEPGSGGARHRIHGPHGRVLSVAFSPDSKTVASAGYDKMICQWEVSSGRERRRFSGHQHWITSVAFSRDGKTLASGSWDTTLRLWEIATGKERHRFTGHRGAVFSVSFSPDGKALASGSWDTTALVWNPIHASGEGKPVVNLTSQELATCWADLAAEDATKAGHAIWILVSTPPQTVPFLRKVLHALPLITDKQVDQLVADLDSDRFSVRQTASRKLGELGLLAEPALRHVLENRPSLEVRRRVEELLNRPSGLTLSGDLLRAVRALEILEHIGTPEARRALEELARRQDETWLGKQAHAALKRLNRL